MLVLLRLAPGVHREVVDKRTMVFLWPCFSTPCITCYVTDITDMYYQVQTKSCHYPPRALGFEVCPSFEQRAPQVFTFDRCCTETEEGIQAIGRTKVDADDLELLRCADDVSQCASLIFAVETLWPTWLGGGRCFRVGWRWIVSKLWSRYCSKVKT